MSESIRKAFCKAALVLVAVSAMTGCNAIGNARTDIAPAKIYGPQHRSQMYLGTCADDKSAIRSCGEFEKFIAAGASFREASLAASGYAISNPADTTGRKGAVQRYINSGAALADLYCGLFFQQISQSAAHRKFLRSEVNDFGGLVTALMTATGSNATSIASSSAIFTLLDSTAENYDASYMVAPELSRVQRLVTKAQNEYLANHGKEIDDFHAAQRFLVQYADNCSFNGIRGLVNESIDAAEPRTDANGNQSLRATSSESLPAENGT